MFGRYSYYSEFAPQGQGARRKVESEAYEKEKSRDTDLSLPGGRFG